jgi:hypothetical protein
VAFCHEAQKLLPFRVFKIGLTEDLLIFSTDNEIDVNEL